MDIEEWVKLSMDRDSIASGLARAAAHRPTPLVGQTFIKRGDSFSRPVWLECNDSKIYVVKGRHAGRAIFNDQIIARLGHLLGAPVGQPVFVTIPEELKQIEPQMHDISSGLAHGTLWIPDTTERLWLAYTDKDYNRSRFALLSVLYGWLGANDNQLVYSNQDPYLVYSVDHGHFFPGGPDWNIQSLANSPEAQPHPEICASCGLNDSDIKAALVNLNRIADDDIIEMIGLPPDEWGVSMDERIEISNFIMSRRDEMLVRFSGKGE
jgi:hypothetical protein